MLEITEESQLASIEEALARKFEGRLPRDKVHAIVEESTQQVRDAARLWPQTAQTGSECIRPRWVAAGSAAVQHDPT
jgi:hypothetical protein